jgi:hypothetical protein
MTVTLTNSARIYGDGFQSRFHLLSLASRHRKEFFVAERVKTGFMTKVSF